MNKTHPINKAISKKILKKRREKGLTQEELAAKIDVSQAFIHQLESSKKAINLERVNDIALALNCTLHDLLPEIPIEDNKHE
ncbi:helix-turn-helix domain-containing protein [Vibrio splendidus]|uniref:HTH cro/C1-type domain-containing protein n=1 Tax=Vibrio splendidus TaxID=29497 RepID=A0A2N7K162_VIBSP|nr:helix-turn-helix transcriptional regulator [Vibrio splendidus]PMM66929.1 hypothetical protein BCT54_00360 [Vibrio splendidus]